MSTEDRAEIIDNIYAYSYAWDAQDIESFLQVFTADAVWEAWASGSQEAELRLDGRQRIREWGEARLSRRKGKFVSRHFQTNIVFDQLDAASARTRTMVLVTHQGVGEETPSPIVSGVYFDEHQRTPEGWKIRRRVVKHDRSSPHVSTT
jgi:hypothetical protein